MMEAIKLNNKKSEIENLLNQISLKAKEYLAYLKEESVSEIMSGSILQAKELLDKILPIQIAVDEFSNSKENLINALNFKKDNIKSDLRIITQNKVLESKSIQSNSIIRSNILKALIYLGGNADLFEISDFVKREIFKCNHIHEKEKTIFDDKEKLLKIISEESYLMLKDGLVIEDNLSKKWEILPAGIDSLSKYDVTAKAN